MDRADLAWLERVLDRPIMAATSAEWGVGDNTSLVTVDDGTGVVVQRYRLGGEADRRMRIMNALRDPAAARGITIPGIHAADIGAQPPWIAFDMLPGAPSAETAMDGPHFPALARAMGAMLADFSELPCTDVELDDMWARPRYLAARADAWAECLAPALSAAQSAALEGVLADLPALFDGRPAVLAHGDYAPVNILVEDGAITGLLDFESVCVADPLYDPARWAWSVGFAGRDALARSWPEFLRGAGIDPGEPALAERIRSLQVICTMEMLADADLAPGLWRIVHDRLVRLLG
ncbi:aminoglycoside phosphotransferase family protein [Nocardia jiangxiensis]|uniref:Aminoglycoside phosphotransferase family protein n=1 Tax=Nocardia jiangxiensis TaxID=282685 RepID=A0ABW6RQT3_9NOCA|nr:aminoglycoside phosphotransferase family protein [Nocardia jiangxiensis]